MTMNNMTFFQRYSFAATACNRVQRENGRAYPEGCFWVSFQFAMRNWKSLHKIWYRMTCGGDPYLADLVERLGLTVVEEMNDISKLRKVMRFAEKTPSAHNFNIVASRRLEQLLMGNKK